VAEIKKQKYVYYHCTRWRGDCRDPYARQEVLRDQFASMLRGLVIPKEVIECLQAEVAQSDLTERSAMDQAIRRAQGDLERLETRLSVLYEDRLDGRITPDFFDQKAVEMRDQQDRLRHRLAEYHQAQLAPAKEALDLMELTSKACGLFLGQPSAEKRKLIVLITQEATWQSGELRSTLREPFEHLRLSNCATQSKESPIRGGGQLLEIWRRERDSNPRRINRICNLQIPRCQECPSSQGSRRAFPKIAQILGRPDRWTRG
jgi:site-specific DNA recombinase